MTDGLARNSTIHGIIDDRSVSHQTIVHGHTVNEGTHHHATINSSTPNVHIGSGSITVNDDDFVVAEFYTPPMLLGRVENENFDREPPEHLIDNLISFELINEAVMMPNGVTYDRKCIQAQIQQQGQCPVTRQPLSQKDLGPNRVLQRAN